FSVLIIHLTIIYKLFPYTTLFRSVREEIMARIYVILESLLENVSIKKTRDLLDFLVINIEKHANSYNEYEGHIDQEVLQETIDRDRKSTRLNSSHVSISYAVFCLK